MMLCNCKKKASLSVWAVACLMILLLNNSGDAALNKTIEVGIIKAEIKSVVFVNDHNVLIDYNNNFAGDGTSGFIPRGWVRDGANNPVSFSKGTTIEAKATVCVTPAGVDFDLVGDGSGSPESFDLWLNFKSKETRKSTGSDQEVELIAIEPLPYRIGIIGDDFEGQSIEWSIISNNIQISAGSSGPHIVYVTWDKPFGTSPTLKRVDWVCYLAKGARDLDEIEYKIGADAVAGKYFGENSLFNSPEMPTAWQAMDGVKADCGTLSTLMKHELEMLGVQGSEVRFVYARHASWDGLVQEEASRTHCEYNPGNPLDRLELYTPLQGGGGGLNAWEGCCVFRNHWWMGGYNPVGIPVTSPVEVLYAITTTWSKDKNDNIIALINEDGENRAHQYWTNDVFTAVPFPDPPFPQQYHEGLP